MRTDAILNEVLATIKPTSTPTQVKTMLAWVNASLRKHKIKAVARLGGSFAKDTWLADDHDVDIFVAFDKKNKDEDLSGMLAKALAPLKPERVHGSRDYFLVERELSFEIIPVLAISKASDARNITDFSLKHVSWVNANGKRLKDDIRLAKKFCKAQRVYGAESYIRGFSGHLLDLLVIKYGGFLRLLRAASRWDENKKTVIDVPNAHKGNALQTLNTSKTGGPLIVVDPVQHERNAAASLTSDNYLRFIIACRKFLAVPHKRFFERQPIDTEKLRKRGTLVRILASPTTGSDDIVGTRFLKLYEYSEKALLDAGFSVVGKDWQWQGGDATMWFVTKEKTLPPTQLVNGPPATMKEHAAAFRKKHKKTRVVKGRVVATVPIQHRTPSAVLRASVVDEYAHERARRIRVVEG